MFPDYKKNRVTKKKTPEEEELSRIAHPQFEIVREEVLPQLGFNNNFIQDGLEGDDLIAKIVLEYDWTNFAIVTIDSDIYQVLRNNAFIYNPRKKKRYTLSDFQDEWGINPWQWSTVLSIAGCTTDNVPGINGVGKPTAIKYLKKQLPVSGKIVQRIQSQEGKEIRRRNDWLVRLPFHDTNSMTVRKKQRLSKDAFLKVCRKYGFESFLRKDKYREWKEVMELG
jgi:DNA polymerase-1